MSHEYERERREEIAQAREFERKQAAEKAAAEKAEADRKKFPTVKDQITKRKDQ